MALEVRNITCSFPKAQEPTLKDVSFCAPDGLVTSLIGANGVGKSTLLKTIMGLYSSTGTVLFNGIDRATIKPNQLFKYVSYMTQQGASITSLKVLEVVLLGRMHSLHIKVDDAELEKAWSVLKLLKLEHLANRPYCALSGGQQRIVCIAQTIIREPRIFLLDEPTANLDMQNELEVLALIQAYTRQKNITTVLTLHDLNMAARFSDKVILLKDGSVYMDGSPEKVITKEAVCEAYGVQAHIHTDRNGMTMLYPMHSVYQQEYHFN
ncbi:MAG: ABC transporter ATP-binding protein [Lachnospiraceae bacterium]|nr:ABC transporter ATP-binding protein [Lachnospiraceae bacterium]